MKSNLPQQGVAYYARLFFTGLAMGSADIVPGVSGGTMAFIMGVYNQLIDAIKSFNLDLVKMVLRGDIKGALEHVPWRFLLALGGGIVLAIVLLVNLLTVVLERYPIYLFSFFTGLIVASIIAIGAQVRWDARAWIALAIAAVGAFLLMGLRPQEIPNTPLIVFFSGMVAITAMILPGVSGSFLLLILGQYEHVIGSIEGLLEGEAVAANLTTIGAMAAGCVIGIVIFSRILSWLLNNYENVTIAALVGFMAGSLRVIWPFKNPVVAENGALVTYVDTEGVVRAQTSNVLPWLAMHVESLDEMTTLTMTEVGFSIALMFVGLILVSLLDHAQSGRNPLLRLMGFGRNAQPIDQTAATTGD